MSSSPLIRKPKNEHRSRVLWDQNAPTIPLSVPCIRGNEWKYIKECLDTEWVSSVGKYVDLFERRIAEYTGAKYTIACVNGTSALHLSLRLAGVKAEDEVIVPTITFIAPVNVVRYLGAEPVFMDADRYYNIDCEKTVDFITHETRFKGGSTFNKVTGRRIAAIIPVHVFGNAVKMDDLVEICAERNIPIVEDATESLGTRYISGSFKHRYTGTIGRLGCLSFNGNKIITAGGGGMILTDDEDLAGKARYLSTQAKNDPLRYVHDEIGYNFRLTNVQAAIGVAQLEQLAKFLQKKKEVYRLYRERIDCILGLRIAEVPSYAGNNHWMIALQIDKDVYGKDRETLMISLGEHGVQTRPLWQLNHLQKPYKDCQNYKIERAFELGKMTLNLPCSVNIGHEQIETAIRCLGHV